MIYKNLYIIGNGFDLHHDIPCSFKNFRDWAMENDASFIYSLTKVYNNAWDFEWWKDFENSLSQLNISSYAGKKGNLYDPEYVNEESIEKKTQYASNKIVEEFSTLKDSMINNFQKWLNDAYSKCNKEKIIHLHSTNSIFLSFNYTKTLEEIYNIDTKYIYHIHGIIDDKNSMVVGHGLKHEDMLDALESQKSRGGEIFNKKLKIMTRLQYVEPAHTRLATLRTLQSLLSLKKDVKCCIEKNKRFFDEIPDVQRIFVYGFSFSPIDMPYIEKIIRRTAPDTHWIISWHSLEDKRQIMDFVIRYNIQNITMINGIRTISIQ